MEAASRALEGVTAGLACQARRVRGPEEGCQASHWVRGGQSAPPQQLRGVVGAAGLPQLSLWSPPVLHSRAGWTGLPCISGGGRSGRDPKLQHPLPLFQDVPRGHGEGTAPVRFWGLLGCPGPQQRGTGGRALGRRAVQSPGVPTASVLGHHWIEFGGVSAVPSTSRPGQQGFWEHLTSRPQDRAPWPAAKTEVTGAADTNPGSPRPLVVLRPHHDL